MGGLSRSRVFGATGALLLMAAGCGGDETPLVLDSVPATEESVGPPETLPVDTSSPASAPVATASAAATTAVAPQLGPWVDVTGTLAGLASDCGNMYFVAADPGRDRIIVAVAAQGLWADAPGAEDEWTPLGTGGGSATVTNRTSTIVFDPVSPDRFWESGHYGPNLEGAFTTTDGGITFERLGDVEHLDGISVDLTDPERQTMLAGAHERPELFRSTDGGDEWTNLAANLPADVGFAAQPLVIDASTHLLGSYRSAGAGIFRTTDGGATWQQVAEGGVVGAPLVSSADGSIYWLLESGGLVRSTDAGVTWTQVSGAGVLRSNQIIELPDGRLASVNESHVVVSDDQGSTWVPLGPPFPTAGAYGLAYSAPRDTVYVHQWDCGNIVPAGSLQRLDLSPGP